MTNFDPNKESLIQFERDCQRLFRAYNHYQLELSAEKIWQRILENIDPRNGNLDTRDWFQILKDVNFWEN